MRGENEEIYRLNVTRVKLWRILEKRQTRVRINDILHHHHHHHHHHSSSSRTFKVNLKQSHVLIFRNLQSFQSREPHKKIQKRQFPLIRKNWGKNLFAPKQC